MKKRSSERGFSVTEMTMATLVVATMLALSLPILQSFRANYQLNAAARHVASDIAAARFLSISRNVNYYIGFDLTNRRYRIDDNNLLQINTASSANRPLPKNATFQPNDVLNQMNNRIGFNGLGEVVGMPPGSAQVPSIIVQNSAGRRRIQVTRLGHITVEKVD